MIHGRPEETVFSELLGLFVADIPRKVGISAELLLHEADPVVVIVLQVVHGVLAVHDSSHQVDVEKAHRIVVYILHSAFRASPYAALEPPTLFKFTVQKIVLLVFNELPLVSIKEISNKVLHGPHRSHNVDNIQLSMQQSLLAVFVKIFGSVELL